MGGIADDGAMSLRPLLPLIVLLVGCGAKMHPITPGSLTCKRDACNGVQLAVSANEVTFTADGKTVTRTIKAWPQDRWPNLCPHGTRALRSEVWELGPDPLDVGKIHLEKPALVADCLGGTSLHLRTVDGNDLKVPMPELVFER